MTDDLHIIRCEIFGLNGYFDLALGGSPYVHVHKMCTKLLLYYRVTRKGGRDATIRNEWRATVPVNVVLFAQKTDVQYYWLTGTVRVTESHRWSLWSINFFVTSPSQTRSLHSLASPIKRRHVLPVLTSDLLDSKNLQLNSFQKSVSIRLTFSGKRSGSQSMGPLFRFRSLLFAACRCTILEPV